MTGFLPLTLRCLAAERLKLKRTLAPVLTVFFPAVPGALTLLLTVRNGPALPRGIDPAGSFLSAAFSIWCVVLLPLYVALTCSSLAGIEHQNHGFRRLLSLPVPRSSVYLAKLATSFALLAIAFALLLLGSAVSLRIASSLLPDAGLGAFPWAEGVRLTAVTFAASMFLLFVHGFVALRWPSYSLNVSLAVVGIVLTLSFSDRHPAWLPWSLPVSVQNAFAARAFGWGGLQGPSPIHGALLCGSVAALSIFVLGGRALVRRDVV